MKVQVLASHTVGPAELVVNGRATPLPCKLETDGVYTCGSRLTLRTTAWIAARWLADEDKDCGRAHRAGLLPERRSAASGSPR